MKLFFLIFVSSFLSAQININDLVSRIDLDGTERKYLIKDVKPYTGKVFFNYENGNKEFEGYLKDGLQNGHWIWYYINGVKKEEGEFKKLHQESLWTKWYESGQMKEEGEYVNGKKQGTWSLWYENGVVSSAEPYRSGRLHGKLILWYDSGNKEGEALYVHGLKDSYDRGWYDNGAPQWEFYWKNNLNLFNELKNNNVLNRFSKSFFYFGVLSCVFLILHASLLGLDFDSKLFGKIRRLIIILFILFELSAQILLTIHLYKFRRELKKHIRSFILRVKITFITIVLSICSYYYTHRRSHREPEWAKKNIPWHYDHHMALNQNMNYGVRSDVIDRIMGTREKMT